MSNWYTNFQKSASAATTALGQKVSDTTSNVRNSALGQQASDAATALGQKVSDTTSNVRTSPLGKQVSDATSVVKDNVSSTATALGKNVSLLHGQLSSAATNARETASGLLEILSDTATDMNSLTKFIKKFTLLSYKNAGSI